MTALTSFRRASAVPAATATRRSRHTRDATAGVRPQLLESLESRFLLSTYYVNASGGADTNAGTSDAAAFRTLQKAANLVVAGDTVLVRPGTYAGFRRMNVPGGTAASPITFSADPGVIVNSFGPGETNALINIENTNAADGYYVIEGFEVNANAKNRGIRSAGSRFNVIRNNVVHDADDSNIFASRSDRVVVENNVCYNAAGQHGIYVNGSDAYVIRGNECYNNNWDGIHTNVSDGVNQVNSNGLIENNVVHDNLLAGMDLTGINNAVIRNNLAYGNGRHAIVLQNSNANPTIACHDVTIVNNTFDARSGSSAWAIQISAISPQPSGTGVTGNDQGVVIFNNVLIGNTASGNGAIGDLAGTVSATFRSDYNVVVDALRTGGTQRSLASWQTATGQDAHSLVSSASVLFVNPAAGDYHLKAGVPALDLGVAGFNGKDAPAADFEGDVRPQGLGYDAGYDELAGPVTPDTTPPLISAVASGSLAAASATITWVTNEPADTQVEYGTTAAYGSSTTRLTARTTSHSQVLSGLLPSTTYHYRVRSADAAGNVSTSADFTFTTAEPDTAAPVISAVAASAVTASGARITWASDEPATTQVEYGTTAAYGSVTTPASALVTAHAQGLSGLAPETVYHYRVLSRDAAGNLAVSEDFSFTTAAAPVPPTQVFSPVPYYGDLADYATLNASRWSVVQEGGDERLSLNTTSYSELDASRLGEMARPVGRTFGDFDLELSARTGDDLAANPMADYAIVFGYVDANDYTYLMMNATAGFTSFRAVVNGVQTVIGTATGPGVPDAAWHDVLLTRRGNTVTASLDGRTLISATSPRLGLVGQVAIGSYNDAAYFDDFVVTTPAADTTAPTAVAAAIAPILSAGTTDATFTVTYRDDVAVKSSSIDGGDILVSGPGGFSAAASLVSVDAAGDGTPRVATYRVNPPGGSWDYVDNGTYTLALRAGEVTDTAGNAAAAGALGSFTVDIPDTVPPAIEGVAAVNLGENVATITWSTDEAADSQVEFGATSDYGQRTAVDGSLVTEHGVALAGLAPVTTYHYHVLSRDAAGNLAESRDFTFTTAPAADPLPPVVDLSSLSVVAGAPGTPVSFTATYSDPNGSADLAYVYLRANADLPTMLDAVYFVSTNLLYLRDDSGALVGGFAPGSAQIISNSCGSLNCAGVTVTRSDAAITVNWVLTANQCLAGSNVLYVRARDLAGNDSGYQRPGGATWTVTGDQNPALITLTPGTASDPAGTPRTFTATYTDPDGWSNLEFVYLRLNADVTTMVNAIYHVPSNRLYLRGDTGTALIGGFAPGSDNVISNAAGSLNCAAVTVTPLGNNLTVNWNLTANRILAGTNRVYVRATDRGGRDTGYRQLSGATWTIAGNEAPTVVGVSPGTAADAVGTSRVFTATYSDPDGWANLHFVWLTLNQNDPARRLQMVYCVLNNKLYMISDDGKTLIGGFAPGSANVITTARGSVDCAATSVTRGGNAITVNWALRGTAALVGVNTLWLRAYDHGGSDTLYQNQAGAEWVLTQPAAL